MTIIVRLKPWRFFYEVSDCYTACPTCRRNCRRKRQTGVLAKVPLDSGWLTGRYNSESCFEGVRQRWSIAEIRQRARLVSALDWLTSDGSSLAHKALAYLLAYPEVSCVIPGIRTRKQLLDNLAASECVLNDWERKQLENFWNEFTYGGKDLLPW